VKAGILIAAVLFWLQAASSVKDGVYTEAQARRGKEIYASACAGCHADTLEGSGQIPPLTGPEFLNNWKGQTLADLFDKMKTTMPADAPGKLSNEQNIDLLAFLLSFNKFPAGSAELKYDRELLQRIRIE
jgi:mono/diheme cytochrome c family protein